MLLECGQERHFVDLHIHSRYSRATSPALTPANLELWGNFKGLSLIGTGDLTHPAWLSELSEALVLGNDGFYGLKNKPGSQVRFVPTGEVSAIYKHHGRTRKIHLVILAPDLEVAAKFSKTLGALGNVQSDGRPILGLSARTILEIALTTHPNMMVIPAHIWTPWFSLFGAKSGYDCLEECFGDLSPHITALETGLSSDPAMNRLVSSLDPYALISSSDAHSPDKLGREATILLGPLTWPNLIQALKGGPSLGGTVEFFPEEGKYHLDGHLACGPPLTPDETKKNNGLCPICGKPVTIGVLHRVTELADRQTPLENRLPDYRIIALPELLGQVFGQGPKSKRVTQAFDHLVSEFGSEFNLLLKATLDDIKGAAGPLLSLGIERMRRGEISAQGGFDGQFGTVTAITAADRALYQGQGQLFEFSSAPKKTATPTQTPPIDDTAEIFEPDEFPEPELPSPFLALMRGDLLLDGLDENQAQAVTSLTQTLAVTAGPGSGKTRVLVHRAAWLIRENIVAPEEMLLTTYTRKAAAELAPRLAAALPFRPQSRKVQVMTLHSLAYKLLKEKKPDWELASEDFLTESVKKAAKKSGLKAPALAALISQVKNSPSLLPGETDVPKEAPEGFQAAFRHYHRSLALNKYWDFDDLILEAEPLGAPPFKALLVDEFQDMSAAQFSFIKRLVPPGSQDSFLTVIGDPDQSIYSFRGASPKLFDWLQIYPGLQTVDLATNYRSTKAIVRAGEAILNGPSTKPRRHTART